MENKSGNVSSEDVPSENGSGNVSGEDAASENGSGNVSNEDATGANESGSVSSEDSAGENGSGNDVSSEDGSSDDDASSVNESKDADQDSADSGEDSSAGEGEKEKEESAPLGSDEAERSTIEDPSSSDEDSHPGMPPGSWESHMARAERENVVLTFDQITKLPIRHLLSLVNRANLKGEARHSVWWLRYKWAGAVAKHREELFATPRPSNIEARKINRQNRKDIRWARRYYRGMVSDGYMTIARTKENQ